MRQAFRTLVGGIEAMVGPKLPDLTEVPPPFFGRGADLEVLRHALHDVRVRSECRSVGILAGAGIGKTRLLDEFVREVQLLDDPPVRVFRSAATKDGSRWSCFTQLLSQRFDLGGAQGLEEAKAAVRGQVAGVLDDRRVGDVLYLLGDLLELEFPKSPVTKALEDGGPQSSVLKRTVLKSLLEADAGYGPMCFVFDDLHLCHDHTLSLLRFLIENVRAPVMFLAAARPELLARSEGAPDCDRHTFLQLEALGELDTAALIGSLLTPDGVTPMHLVEQAREVTGGNPSRIEETARVFRETGTLPPPPSGEEAGLDARIDALAVADRLLLQKAALMGGVFWLGALVLLDRAESEPPVLWNQGIDQSRRELAERFSHLAEREYLLRLPDSTFPGDEEYVFRRRLERDRVQAMTSPADAQRWHRLLADWLDGKPEVRSHEEYLEMLAEQREKSGALELAGIAYFEAADRARISRAWKRELAYCEKALALLGQDQYSRRLDALLRAGELLERFGKPEIALERYRDALVLAYRLDRRPSWVTARLAATRLLIKLGRVDESMRHLQSASEPVQQTATPTPPPPPQPAAQPAAGANDAAEPQRAAPEELRATDPELPPPSDAASADDAPPNEPAPRHAMQAPPPVRAPVVTLDFGQPKQSVRIDVAPRELVAAEPAVTAAQETSSPAPQVAPAEPPTADEPEPRPADVDQDKWDPAPTGAAVAEPDVEAPANAQSESAPGEMRDTAPPEAAAVETHVDSPEPEVRDRLGAIQQTTTAPTESSS